MTLKPGFKFSVNRAISDSKLEIYENLKPGLRVMAEQINIERLTTLAHTRLGSQTTRLPRLLADMKTVQFSVEFNVRDLMRDPEMRKVLQEREQAYQKNMAWLDEDLNRRIREDEEKQRLYEDNLAWLDDDLNEKLDQRHRENLAWLDDDLNDKLEKRKRDILQEIQTSSEVTETQPQRTPKIWHCGHGVPWHFSGERASNRATIAKEWHEKGIQEKFCVIGHNDDQLQKKGNNTRRQYEKFNEDAQEGDIVFTHCSIKGGLTHWGVYTGEIINIPYTRTGTAAEATSRYGINSKIMVYQWYPLPEVLKGAGRNSTLYEVKPTFKNYQNYSIPS